MHAHVLGEISCHSEISDKKSISSTSPAVASLEKEMPSSSLEKEMKQNTAGLLPTEKSLHFNKLVKSCGIDFRGDESEEVPRAEANQMPDIEKLRIELSRSSCQVSCYMIV